ncbi:MAG: CBS domain-containing protein [Desulfobacterales bacterium]|nr:CBS domain-containing protein [Desulfobacterales bacterium]
MNLLVQDIMVRDFDTIHINAPIEEAIDKILNGKIRDTGYKTISIMVIDEFNRLSGVITMFDILYHLRPSFLNYGIKGEELQWDGIRLQNLVKDLKGKKVNQVMNPIVVGASPTEHIMAVLDRMIKNRYRRLPVLQNNKPIGIIYISEIFHSIFSDEDL